MSDETTAKVLREIADALDKASRDWDFGEMTGEQAYSAALSAVSDALKEAAKGLS